MRKALPYLLATLSCILVALALYSLWQMQDVRDWIEAKSNVNKYISIEGEDESTLSLSAILAQADAYLAEGDLTRALELYEKALEVDAHVFGKANIVPDSETETESDIWIMRKLFDTAMLLGDQERAESVLGLLAFRGVSESVLDALRGFLLLRQGDIEGARALFEQEPGRSENAYGLMLVEIIDGNHEEASASLAVLHTSNDPLLAYVARSVQGAYDEFALFEDGKDEHLDTLLARSLAQIGQCPTSEILLADVVSKDADYRDAWIVLGYCRLMLQEYEGALAAFDKAYDLDPEKSETQYFLGLANERLGNVTEAEKFYEYALRNGFVPRYTVHEKLAEFAVREGGRYEKAAEHLRAVLEEDSEAGIDVYRTLVIILIEHLDNVDDARIFADSAHEAFGDIAETLDLDGWISYIEGDIDDAAALLSTAVQQDPTLATAWYHKGMLEERVGDLQGAIVSYRNAYDFSVGMDNALAKLAADKHNGLVGE